jgi:hypothetical protein
MGLEPIKNEKHIHPVDKLVKNLDMLSEEIESSVKSQKTISKDIDLSIDELNKDNEKP